MSEQISTRAEGPPATRAEGLEDEDALDYFLEHLLSEYLFMIGDLYEIATKAETIAQYRERILQFTEQNTGNEYFTNYMAQIDEIWVGDVDIKIYVPEDLKVEIQAILGS